MLFLFLIAIFSGEASSPLEDGLNVTDDSAEVKADKMS